MRRNAKALLTPLGEDALKEDQTLVEKHDVNSPKKKHFEKFLIDRIGVAIEKAIAAGSSDFRASSVALGEKDAPRYIKAKFASSDWYIVPWEACFSWEVGILLYYLTVQN